MGFISTAEFFLKNRPIGVRMDAKVAAITECVMGMTTMATIADAQTDTPETIAT